LSWDRNALKEYNHKAAENCFWGQNETQDGIYEKEFTENLHLRKGISSSAMGFVSILIFG
jgi:hypothetical protein